MDPDITFIGKYKIEELIAKGGMGEVYKAIHPTLKRYVILKKLTSNSNSQFTDRFNREARIMMDFKNDNIVNVYDHFIDNGFHYIVLEYVDGMSLDTFIQQQRYLSNDICQYITLQISNALVYAHNKNVVHRDIKPGNILISKTGDIKLVDFGIAVSDTDSLDDLTKEGMTLGTPSYMAPEQFKNSKNVDSRADIYSLGVILYEMSTGKKPYPGIFSPKVLRLIEKGKYKKPIKINPDISPLITKLIKLMMTPKPKRRVGKLEKVSKLLEKKVHADQIDEYKKQISDLILGNPINDIGKKRKSFKYHMLIVLLIFLALGVKYNYNLIQFYFTKNIGAIYIEVNYPHNYYKNSDEIFLHNKLYIENGNKLTFVDSNQIRFKVDNDNSGIFYSKSYLPVGEYRVKIEADDNLFWSNFKISSKEISHIRLFIPEQKKETLNPTINVYDQLTGINITKGTNIYIKESSNYRLFNKSETILYTNSVYFFKCEKDGYISKEFILKIDSHQRELNLEINLNKN